MWGVNKMNSIFDLGIQIVTFKDLNYRVLAVLENNFLLVCKSGDIDDNDYPIETFVIPDVR